MIIPAHDEERVIARLLAGLVGDPGDDELEIVVVCNGCTDETAARAEAFAPAVGVVSTEIASKHEALRLGDRVVAGFPRVLIDADVEISRHAVERLIATVGEPGVLAAGPEREFVRDSASLLVRWYYDVWERLPSVQRGLFGRGVIALSETGHGRIRDFPPMLGDDLVVSEAFADTESRIVRGVFVRIRVPRTVRDLYRRKVRVATGNAQADRSGLRRAGSRTSTTEIVRLLRSEPRLILRAPVFLGVTVAGRIGARRAIGSGDFQTWQRDASSRD